MARDIAKTDAYVPLKLCAEEGRDALRPPQAHPRPRPPSASGDRTGPRTSFHLAAMVQNLRKLPKLVPEASLKPPMCARAASP